MNFQFPTIDFRKNTRSAVLFPGVRKQGFRGPPGKTPVFSKALQIKRCALWPVPPWTTLAQPVETVDNPCGLPTVPTVWSGCPPLHCLGGHAPPDPSPLRGPAGLFQNFPQQPNSRTALRGFALPSSWSAYSRDPCAEGRTGGAALGGRGGVAPPVEERPRRGL